MQLKQKTNPAPPPITADITADQRRHPDIIFSPNHGSHFNVISSYVKITIFVTYECMHTHLRCKFEQDEHKHYVLPFFRCDSISQQLPLSVSQSVGNVFRFQRQLSHLPSLRARFLTTSLITKNNLSLYNSLKDVHHHITLFT